jgi:hypothetical protein
MPGVAIPHYAAIFFAGPYLHAVPVDYVMIWPQGFGGLDCQFERFKRLHGMAVMGRDMKRGVQGMALFGLFREICVNG